MTNLKIRAITEITISKGDDVIVQRKPKTRYTKTSKSWLGLQKNSLCSVNASRDQVRNFCKSNSVAGKGIDLIKKIDNLDEHYCKMCGTALIQIKTGRRKLYCSKECKRKWEKLHPVLHEIQCQYCGKVVFVQNADTRKFCSHECYIKNRFWRLDDATEIVKLLLAGKRVSNVPKWMKDLILAEDAD